MNKHGWLLLGLLATAPALAAEKPAEPAATAPAADAAVPAPAPVGDDAWRIGYTLGFSLGQRMGNDITDLDTSAFHEGFDAAFAHQPGKLSPDEMQAAFQLFQEQRVAQMQAAREKLLADNLMAATAFLAENGKRKGVKKTKSGLQYEVLAKGKGKSPQPTDLVTAHYRGTLPNGTEFDSTVGGEPVEFPLDRVIAGWQEGVRLMNKGAKYKFYLPPNLAYGEPGAGEGDVIGPNQALVFEVELISFRAPPPVEMPPAEEAAPAPAAEAAPAAAPL